MRSTRLLNTTGAGLLVAAGLLLAACDKPIVTSQAPAATPAPAPATNGNSASVGRVVDDAVITGKVKASLLGDPDVKGTDINVDTRNGVVDLNGAVQSQAQIDKATSLAKSTEGVSAVNNNLSIKP
jgi:hyperosmotically inducible protein